MQAVLLATSETNKLHPLTETIPSPMLPVAGRPVMSYPLELLIRQEFKHIIVNLYSLASCVEAYFGTGSRWGVELQYILQSQPWGSAGALRWSRQHLTETFVVLPADQLIDLDLDPIVEQHQGRKSLATVVIHPGASLNNPVDPLSEGALDLSGENVWYETGVYIFDPKVLQYIPTRTSFDISADLIPALAANGITVDCYKVYGYWNNLDTFSDYQAAQEDFFSSAQGASQGTPSAHYSPFSGRKVQEGVWIGRNTNIHPQAQLIPPVFIGENCFVSQGAEVGPYAVLGNNIVVNNEATVAHSTILDGTYVGALVYIKHRLVNKRQMIDTNSGEVVYITDEHLLSKTYQDLKDSLLSRFFDTTAAVILLLLSLPCTFLVGCLLLITTGRIFTTSTYLHRSADQPGAPGTAKSREYKLFRFQTRNAKGEYNWIGRWLERTDLFRIPGLWNAIRGDMRIVGVKPLLPEEDGKIKEAWQEKRYETQPGFTGLWYIQAGSGADLDEIFVADTYYAATRSWAGDWKLLFQTIPTWFRRLKK